MIRQLLQSLAAGAEIATYREMARDMQRQRDGLLEAALRTLDAGGGR